MSISFCFFPLVDAISLTFFSSSVDISWSPTFGVADNPVITTGVLGPAVLTGLPNSSNSALTLPKVCPTKIKSFIFNMPF